MWLVESIWKPIGGTFKIIMLVFEGVNEMKHLNDVSYKDCVGKVFKSTSSGDFKIVKYNNAKNVEIQFLKTGYEIISRRC